MKFLSLLRALSIFSTSAVSALPAGFEDEAVVDVSSVVDIAFAGNMLLVVSNRGILFRYDLEDPDAKEEVALDITSKVC